MEEFVTIPKKVYDILIYNADKYKEDLETGITEGIYENSDENNNEIELLEIAINTEPTKVDVFVFVEGGNIQGASATIPIGFEVFDMDNFNAEKENNFTDRYGYYHANSLDEWNKMIEDGHKDGSLKSVY